VYCVISAVKKGFITSARRRQRYGMSCTSHLTVRAADGWWSVTSRALPQQPPVTIIADRLMWPLVGRSSCVVRILYSHMWNFDESSAVACQWSDIILIVSAPIFPRFGWLRPLGPCSHSNCTILAALDRTCVPTTSG